METGYTYPRPARDRLLRAADQLFYAEGINAVGVERILTTADVAKATLYANFGGKSELVRAYLEGRATNWRAHVETEFKKRGTDPVGRLLTVFDLLGEWFETPDYRGCPFINAAAECGSDSVVEEVSACQRSWVHGLFRALLSEAGARDIDATAEQLRLLYDGSMVAAQLDHTAEPAKRARDVARLLVDSVTS